MKNYVWQKFGVSTDYNTVVQHPWHSTGQGAAKVALQYIVLSDTMIGAYHNKIALNCLYDPMCLLLVIHSLNKAFIDDVILHATNFYDISMKAQRQLWWWHELIS